MLVTTKKNKKLNYSLIILMLMGVCVFAVCE